ncbi:MAG TPA: hypothetical protein VFW73_01970 [Lacipirellulaceae bacterium]|nr:hypothetical protein [Lacipirellulaceae bacterium]
MESYETFATVEPQGDVRVAGVPFAPGTEVEVTIHPRRENGEAFKQTWERVCRELRAAPQVQSITDDDIQQEIADYRAGP